MRVAVVVCMALGALATTAVAQDFALARLEDSPRHHEWVALEREGRTLHAFVVYPEVGGKTSDFPSSDAAREIGRAHV